VNMGSPYGRFSTRSTWRGDPRRGGTFCPDTPHVPGVSW